MWTAFGFVSLTRSVSKLLLCKTMFHRALNTTIFWKLLCSVYTERVDLSFVKSGLRINWNFLFALCEASWNFKLEGINKNKDENAVCMLIFLKEREREQRVLTVPSVGKNDTSAVLSWDRLVGKKRRSICSFKDKDNSLCSKCCEQNSMSIMAKKRYLFCSSHLKALPPNLWWESLLIRTLRRPSGQKVAFLHFCVMQKVTTWAAPKGGW